MTPSKGRRKILRFSYLWGVSAYLLFAGVLAKFAAWTKF